MTPEERLAAAAWAATQEIAGSSAHRARLDEAVAAMPGINRIEGYVAPSWLRVDEAPAATWNELKQAWRGTEMPTTVAPWGASADRRAAETVVLTGAKFQGPDLPVAAALASHRRSVLAAEADPFFGCTAGTPDWGQDGAAGRPVVSGFRAGDYERTDAPPTAGGWTNQFDGKEVFDRLNTQAADRDGDISDTSEFPIDWEQEGYNANRRGVGRLHGDDCILLRHRDLWLSGWDRYENTKSDVGSLRAQLDRLFEKYNSLLNNLHIGGRSVRAIVAENARLRAELRTMRAAINAALGE